MVPGCWLNQGPELELQRYEKTNVSVEGHEWELAGAVIINNAGYLFGKCAKAESVDNGMVLNVIDDVEMWVAFGEVVVFIVV
jgi:hypothetical protein